MQEVTLTAYNEVLFEATVTNWKNDVLGGIVLVTVHDEVGLCTNGTACSNFIEELDGTGIAQLDGRAGKFQILFRQICRKSLKIS